MRCCSKVVRKRCILKIASGKETYTSKSLPSSVHTPLGSTTEDWYLMVNGYGDIRNNENANWMEVVGTFDQRGTELSWPSTFQSTALKLERRENDQLILEGGISQRIPINGR